MLDRRHLLKAAALVPIAGLAGLEVHGIDGAEDLRFVVDMRRPEAPRLATLAQADGSPLFDPNGEIIALLTDPAQDWLVAARPIIGLTGYADFVLARDVLRHTSRPIRHAVALAGRTHRVVLGPANTHLGKIVASWADATSNRQPQSTSLFWLA